MTGTWPEPRSLASLEALVRGRRCLILDIGANCGAFTLPLARAAGPGSSVLAFEPNPEMAQRLRRNLALNGMERRVDVHQIALSSGRGTMTLTLHWRNLGQSSLEHLPKGKRAHRQVEVEVRPLADFLVRGEHERIVVKIDVERHEDKVLGPMLEGGTDPDMADAVLLEVGGGEGWDVDLEGMLVGRGYSRGAEVEGNVLYMRGAADVA